MDLKKYGTLIGVDINFDLNKFYNVTNTNPPERYLMSNFMLDLLRDSHSYLFSYVDDIDRKNFSSEYNNNFEKDMNEYYSKLPDYLSITQYENWTDDEIERNEDKFFNPETIKKYRDIEKKPIKLNIDKWFPVVDINKLK